MEKQLEQLVNEVRSLGYKIVTTTSTPPMGSVALSFYDSVATTTGIPGHLEGEPANRVPNGFEFEADSSGVITGTLPVNVYKCLFTPTDPQYKPVGFQLVITQGADSTPGTFFLKSTAFVQEIELLAADPKLSASPPVNVTVVVTQESITKTLTNSFGRVVSFDANAGGFTAASPFTFDISAPGWVPLKVTTALDTRVRRRVFSLSVQDVVGSG